MATLKMIKEEPELCIIDDPYVSKFSLIQINSVDSSIEPIEETEHASNTVPVKDQLNVNMDSRTKSHRKYECLKTESRSLRRPNGFINNSCSVCEKSFEKLSEYESLMSQVHNIKPYECSTCGRKFSRKSYLVPHMRVHSGAKPYPCKLCTASFSRASDFKKHNRSHQGIKLFKCELCDRRFTRAFSLKYHLNAHIGEKPFVCEICGVGFRKSTGYYYHKKTLCKNTFECVYCKEKFESRDTLIYHLRTRH